MGSILLIFIIGDRNNDYPQNAFIVIVEND